MTQEEWNPEWVRELRRVQLKAGVKDEYVHHFVEHLRSEHGYGHTTVTRTFDGIRVNEWKFESIDRQDLPRLWVINGDSSLVLAIAGRGSEDDELLALWHEATEKALDHLGRRNSVEWLAILGQTSTVGEYDGVRLKAPTTVNGFTFELANDGIFEDMRVSVTGAGVLVAKFRHWPIRVTGSTQCYSWMDDGEEQALVDLQRIAALLSLHWDTPWTVREGPYERHVRWEGSSHGLQGSSWTPASREFAHGGRPVEVPAWFTPGFAAMRHPNRLSRAIHVHHEGLALAREHSSFALVCFTSAIEAIANFDKNPERCPKAS